MTARHRFAIAVGLALVLMPCAAHGDDVLELPRPATSIDSGDAIITTIAGLKYRVPRGSLIQQPDARAALDAEMKRLQETEVRLVAENQSLRSTASEWSPGWVVVTSAVLAGVVAGAYGYSKF